MSDLPELSGPEAAPASGGPAKQLIIFVHGYGANGEDLISLSRYYAQVAPDAVFISPDAPYRCDGAPMGFQWYDVWMKDPAERLAAIRSSGDRGFGGGIDREIESRGEPNPPQHSKPILLEPVFRFADRPQHPPVEIVLTADEVDDRAGNRMLEDPVDGEIPSQGIGLRRAETHAARAATVLVCEVRPERRDLDHPTPTRYEHDSETRPDASSARKQLENPIRNRLGRHVDVRRLKTEQTIADAPTGEVCLVPMLQKNLGDFACGGSRLLGRLAPRAHVADSERD